MGAPKTKTPRGNNKPVRGPVNFEDTGQRPRYRQCKCPKPLKELGTYRGIHRCRLCGFLVEVPGTDRPPVGVGIQTAKFGIRGSAA